MATVPTFGFKRLSLLERGCVSLTSTCHRLLCRSDNSQRLPSSYTNGSQVLNAGILNEIVHSYTVKGRWDRIRYDKRIFAHECHRCHCHTHLVPHDHALDFERRFDVNRVYEDDNNYFIILIDFFLYFKIWTHYETLQFVHPISLCGPRIIHQKFVVHISKLIMNILTRRSSP